MFCFDLMMQGSKIMLYHQLKTAIRTKLFK